MGFFFAPKSIKMSKSVVGDLLKIFNNSICAVSPRNLVRNSLKYCELNEQIYIAGEKYDLRNKNVYLVGAGKAVQYMALEVEQILGPKIKSGVISIPIGSFLNSSTNKNIAYLEGAKNNLPDENAACTASKINNLVSSLSMEDFLLVLISGGGSALLSLPKTPITLEEKTDLIKRLANAGADIKELNTVRKRLSDLKGGQLAMKAFPAEVVSLILSDIVGNPLHLIASGPTTNDEDSPLHAMKIINKYQLQNDLPKSIESILHNQPDYYGKFPKNNVQNYLIGSNKISTEAAHNVSQSLNYNSMVLSNSITGNVKDVAEKYVHLTRIFCDFLRGKLGLDELKTSLEKIEILEANNHEIIINPTVDNLCLILGGEITVEVKGSGKGGRNQQLALEFSWLLHQIKHEIKDFNVHMLSGGTDGIDGPTDAAGAIGYQDLVADSEADGLNVNLYLNNNDSYNFYKHFRDGSLHVITGHTNTNVMDIHLIVIQRIIKTT